MSVEHRPEPAPAIAYRSLSYRSLSYRSLSYLGLAYLVITCPAPPAIAADPAPQDASTLLSDQQIEQALQQSRTPAAPTRGLHRITQPEPAASVSLNIAFEYNSSDLKPQAYAQLTQLKLALSSAALGRDRIMVAGHTDAKGDPQYNQRLSLRRAEAVKHFLVANGLDARRLQAVGYGSDQPLTPDQPDDPRNRRVEIRDLGEMPP